MQDRAADVGALVADSGHIGGDGEVIQSDSLIAGGKFQFHFAQCGLTRRGGGEDKVVEQIGFAGGGGGGQGAYRRFHRYRRSRWSAGSDIEFIGDVVLERHGCHLSEQVVIFLDDVDLSERTGQFYALLKSTCFLLDGDAGEECVARLVVYHIARVRLKQFDGFQIIRGRVMKICVMGVRVGSVFRTCRCTRRYEIRPQQGLVVSYVRQGKIERHGSGCRCGFFSAVDAGRKFSRAPVYGLRGCLLKRRVSATPG